MSLTLNGTEAAAAFGEARHLSLALQGGGSFGAFTWGFLDRLLEEENLLFDIVSGASIGALNAVLLADGLTAGGRDEARKRLNDFWSRVGRSSPRLPVGPGQPLGAAAAFHLSTKIASPYQLNPLGLNPMRRMLAAEIDFDRLRAGSAIRLLIAATRVKDGRMRLFREDEVTLESVLASACLPMLHHAVEIDGDAHWDGGYSANPPVRQLVIDSDASDIVLVQLMPDEYGALPRMSANIARRMQQIAFTNSLRKELEALDDLREVCRNAPLMHSPLCGKLRALRLHRVSAADTIPELARASVLDSRWSPLKHLREGGRKAADGWLEANKPRARATLVEMRDQPGPVDRRALPRADDTWRSAEPERARPSGGTEKEIAATLAAGPGDDESIAPPTSGRPLRWIRNALGAASCFARAGVARIRHEAEEARRALASETAPAGGGSKSL